MGRGSEQVFFQRRYEDGQQIQEKMFKITNQQGNANQNHAEISPHTCQNDLLKRQQIRKKYSRACEEN